MNLPRIDGVTVGYGQDTAMFDSWGSDVGGGTRCHRGTSVRVFGFYPIDYTTVPHVVVDVMAALGAWHVWNGNAAPYGSCDHRERREVRFLWPNGHSVEELLQKRFQGTKDAIAPDGWRSGDVLYAWDLKDILSCH